MMQRCLFLDPGVLLNLCTIEEGADVLAALPYRPFTILSISDTVYTIERDGETHSCSPATLVTQGILSVVDPHARNVGGLLIELASLGLRGTPGELAALASTTEGMMATDDQATIGLMTSFLPDVPLFTTGALMHQYTALTNPPRARIAQLLQDIRERAVFMPGEQDPFRSWWLSHMEDP
jgi:hypothetical protein